MGQHGLLFSVAEAVPEAFRQDDRGAHDPEGHGHAQSGVLQEADATPQTDLVAIAIHAGSALPARAASAGLRKRGTRYNRAQAVRAKTSRAPRVQSEGKAIGGKDEG